MILNLVDDTAVFEQTVRNHIMSTLVLPEGVVLTEVDGDM